MNDSERERPPVLAQRSGNVSVYAVAAGLASAVPVPFIDALLAGTVRGAAMRRVAHRHGVRLAPAARKVLGDPELRDTRVQGYRVVRSVLSRFVVPLRMVTRLEDAFGALASAQLFDAYLASRPRSRGDLLMEDEAKRVRFAIDRAVAQGAADLATSLPRGVGDTLSELAAAARHDDAEGRTRYEATLDTLLDAIADIPEGVLAGLYARFEQELASIREPG